MIVLDKFRGGRELVPGRELVHHHYIINLMVIYDVVNIFSMKNYKSSRKLGVGLNWYPVVNWSTTITLLKLLLEL